MFKTIGLDFLIYAIVKVGISLSIFLVIKIMSNNLVPEEFGAYGLIASTLTTIAILSCTFLMTSILRFLPRALEKNRLRAFKYVTTQISQMAMGVSLVLSIVALAIFAITGTVRITLLLAATMILASLGTGLLLIYPAYLNARRDRLQYCMATTLQAVMYVALLAIGFELFPDRLATVFGAMALSQAALCLIARPRLSFFRKVQPATWRTLGEFRKYGLPIVLLHVSIQMNSTLDQYIIRYFSDLHSVGLYAANYVLGEKTIYGLTSIAALAVTPHLFRHWESGQHRDCYVNIWRFVLLLCAAGLTLVAVFAVWGEAIARILLSARYVEGAAILPYITLGAVCLGAAALLAEVFTLKERTLELAMCYASATVVNIVANLALVPMYGYMGAAYATLVTYVFLVFVVLWRAHVLVGLLSYLPSALGSLRHPPGASAEL